MGLARVVCLVSWAWVCGLWFVTKTHGEKWVGGQGRAQRKNAVRRGGGAVRRVRGRSDESRGVFRPDDDEAEGCCLFVTIDVSPLDVA